ncbi:MAG TPA: DUF309 domain-containing protein [Terriglobales bacterium]
MRLDWKNGALAKGLRCYEQQEFFAAHEHWESVWLTCEQPQKSFLQALIQLTSAFHHQQKENLTGTRSLLKRASQKLNTFPTCFEQIDVAELRSGVANWLRALEASTTKRFPSYPPIRVIHTVGQSEKMD